MSLHRIISYLPKKQRIAALIFIKWVMANDPSDTIPQNNLLRVLNALLYSIDPACPPIKRTTLQSMFKVIRDEYHIIASCAPKKRNNYHANIYWITDEAKTRYPDMQLSIARMIKQYLPEQEKNRAIVLTLKEENIEYCTDNTIGTVDMRQSYLDFLRTVQLSNDNFYYERGLKMAIRVPMPAKWKPTEETKDWIISVKGKPQEWYEQLLKKFLKQTKGTDSDNWDNRFSNYAAMAIRQDWIFNTETKQKKVSTSVQTEEISVNLSNLAHKENLSDVEQMSVYATQSCKFMTPLDCNAILQIIREIIEINGKCYLIVGNYYNESSPTARLFKMVITKWKPQFSMDDVVFKKISEREDVFKPASKMVGELEMRVIRGEISPDEYIRLTA